MTNTDDKNKFVQLIRENQNIVHKICHLYCYNYEDKRDLYQEITLQQLQKYKKAWLGQSQTLIETNQLTEKQIMDFITRQSNSITTSYRRSLVFDMCFKAGLLVSFLLLAYLLRASSNLIVLNIVLMIASGTMLVLQSKFYREIGVSENQESAIKEFLESKVATFYKKFTKAIYLAALSNPLFFLSGSMFYFYFKYGTVRPMDLEDYLVFSAGLAMSFLIAVFAQLKQYNFQVQQLETCLKDFDEGKMNRFAAKKRKNQRLVLFLLGAGLFVFGLLVVSHFFLR
ncbi:MAG: hypothetical protein ACE5HI_16635 [bacterium]